MAIDQEDAMRSIRRTALALAACAVVATALGAGTAQATSIKPCIGSGSLYTFPTGSTLHPVGWSIQGSGSCPANLQLLLTPKEPQTVRFAGKGTSDTLGLCDGSLLVQHLNLTVRVQYVNTVSGLATTETQYWRSPISLFPLVTPFFQFDQPNHGNVQGAGLVLHHILLNCGNGGTMPAATFGWIERNNP
jgi:hypothetical protein